MLRIDTFVGVAKLLLGLRREAEAMDWLLLTQTGWLMHPSWRKDCTPEINKIYISFLKVPSPPHLGTGQLPASWDYFPIWSISRGTGLGFGGASGIWIGGNVLGPSLASSFQPNPPAQLQSLTPLRNSPKMEIKKLHLYCYLELQEKEMLN